MVDIEKLSKRRKDWLGCFGNIWQSRKVAPGTCMACVFNDGSHTCGKINAPLVSGWSLTHPELKYGASALNK